MKFPALKREIHSLLIKRIISVCILTILVVVGATCYLEFRQLESTLLSAAEKEAKLFVPLFLKQQKTTEQLSPAPELADAIAHTSFIDVKLSTANQEIFFEKSRANGAEVRKRFSDNSITLNFSDAPDGSWILADKRIYLYAVIPVSGLDDDDVLGHMQAIYRSSLADIRAIAMQILMSCLIGVGAVLLCGIVMYPGLFFFHNNLIRNSANLNRANNFLLKQLGTALAKSDVGFPQHNYRLLIYGVRLAEKQKLSRAQIRNFIQGVFLHDIGMLELDRTMLMKPGPLDKKEYALMQNHVKNGAALIKPYRWLRDGLELVRYHHEKYDGSGYPHGLSHDKIPLAARIFAIVDGFDALTSPRPYREPQELERAIELLEQESGSHFDPVLLASFIEMAPQLYAIVTKLEGKSLERELNGVLKKHLKF